MPGKIVGASRTLDKDLEELFIELAGGEKKLTDGWIITDASRNKKRIWSSVPPMITGLTVDNVTQSAIFWSWDAFPRTVVYLFQWSDDPNRAIRFNSASQTSLERTGLARSTRIGVRVRAMSKISVSDADALTDWSEYVYGTTLAGTVAPQPPPQPPPSPTNLVAEVTGSYTGSDGSYTYTFVANARGGTSPYTYSWSGSTTGSAGYGETITRTVTVKDSGGRSATATATVTTPSAPGTPLSVKASASISGANGAYSVEFSASASGGTTPYTYKWNGATSVSAGYSSTLSRTVTVTDGAGNSASDTVSITTPAITAPTEAPSVSISVPNVNGNAQDITVSWSAVARATNYRVTLTRSGITSRMTIRGATSATFAGFGGHNPAGRVSASVLPRNSAGSGPEGSASQSWDFR